MYIEPSICVKLQRLRLKSKAYCQCSNFRLFCMIIAGVLSFYLVYVLNLSFEQIFMPKRYPVSQTEKFPILSSYLIWNPSCQIPNIDPFNEESTKKFKKKNYISCADYQITYVSSDNNLNGILSINFSSLNKPVSEAENISCCYSNIIWPSNSKRADSKIKESECKYFNSTVALDESEEFVITKCTIKNKSLSETVYKNAHMNLQMKNKTRERLQSTKKYLKNAYWNVLIIGIDTLSRINLARAMPATRNFLTQNSWLDFQGYNKIDDNTFPNLMAFLTGRNQSRARKTCKNSKIPSMDNCDFIWKLYQKYGYATAYGEDYITLDTFGKPRREGFREPPTDHFLRPLFMAVEKFKFVNGERVRCTDQLTSGETLFNYFLSFVQKYEDYPYFALLWANSFSHDNLNSPSRMDLKTLEFLERLTSSGSLNRTLVIFMSDHGIRYGDLRATLTGYYEERLPAFYMWVPPMFKKVLPVQYDNILQNTQRLVTPYDFYMTLQDILKMSVKENISISDSEACPSCHSLFRPVSWNRTCESAGISPHWCTCHQLQTLPLNHVIGNRAIGYIFDKVFENMFDAVNKNNCRICAKLNLHKIISIYVYNYSEINNFNDYLVVFTISPGKMTFESTVRHDTEFDTFSVQGILSRLTPWTGTGNCVKSESLKKYCYCLKECKS